MRQVLLTIQGISSLVIGGDEPTREREELVSERNEAIA
jgi:hypothetical protein